MRFTVAGFTLRDYAMDASMTKDTGQFGMLSGARFQKLSDVTVAGPTIHIRNIHSIGNIKGLVHRVTLDTVFKLLPLSMRLMALKTTWYVTMFGMTEGAIYFGMGTGMFVNLLNLLRMTGLTGRFGLALEDYIKRLMGISMAGQTVGKFKM